MRKLIVIILTLLVAAPVVAQETETPWQDAVTGQIQAFRAGDAEAALEFAGAGFKATYDDAERFLADIERAGYGPIVSSRSHSFGTFQQFGETAVIQIVNFVGPDQSLFEAAYRLADEPGEGWRVQAVVLREREGIGI